MVLGKERGDSLMAKYQLGKQTLQFPAMPAVASAFSTVGKKEGKGPMCQWFDAVLKDDKCGQDTWEEAESKILQDTILGAIKKAGKKKHEMDVIFSGDLINQLMSSCYAVRDLEIPFLGIYGACSTMAESLLMSAAFVNSGYADFAVATASSHFCTAERQFRLPLEHGNQKPPSAQRTVTGAGSAIVGRSDSSNVKIEMATIGKIVDMGIDDPNMMGAAMAPAAIDTLIRHFQDTGRDPGYYDRIFSGDLGRIGKAIVLDSMKKKGFDLSGNYEDCGAIIFSQKQDAHSGGSGCGCSGAVFSGYVYQQMKRGKWKHVLFMSTGALLSTISTQQGESIPGIAHAVALTAEKGEA